MQGWKTNAAQRGTDLGRQLFEGQQNNSAEELQEDQYRFFPITMSGGILSTVVACDVQVDDSFFSITDLEGEEFIRSRLNGGYVFGDRYVKKVVQAAIVEVFSSVADQFYDQEELELGIGE